MLRLLRYKVDLDTHVYIEDVADVDHLSAFLSKVFENFFLGGASSLGEGHKHGGTHSSWGSLRGQFFDCFLNRST